MCSEPRRLQLGFDFQMNAGGALGDLNWLDEGDIPMVSFSAHDPFAPYETAVLIVPTTNEPVVEVSGMDIHEEINGYATNNNAILPTPNSWRRFSRTWAMTGCPF